MKKLIFTLIFAVLTTTMFAQIVMESKETIQTEQKATLHCYFMKDNAMSECWGDKATPMENDATLKNGTMVDTKGNVVMKDGKKATLKNGECILAQNGKIGTMDKMHSKNHKMKT